MYTATLDSGAKGKEFPLRVQSMDLNDELGQVRGAAAAAVLLCVGLKRGALSPPSSTRPRPSNAAGRDGRLREVHLVVVRLCCWAADHSRV